MNQVIKLVGYRDISQEDIKVLQLLYNPILNNNAINLYLLLVSLVDQHYTSYEEISIFLSKHPQEIDALRTLLEEYKLLRTYVEKDKKSYLIEIQKPLSLVQFLTHPLYARVLHHKIKTPTFQKLQKLYTQVNNYQHLEEITKVIDLGNDLLAIEEDADEYEKIVEFGIQHQFDYARFIQLSDIYMIPPSIIENRQILNKIGEYAYIYDIDVNNMARFVGRSVNLSNNTINFNYLLSLITHAEIKITDQNTTKMHPLQYLKSLQKGVDPIASDRKLIEKLITVYRFDYDLINLLIDYSLAKNNNRIANKYIEKIASTWLRDNIKTVEEAKKALELKPKTTKKERMEESWKQEVDLDVEVNLDEITWG